LENFAPIPGEIHVDVMEPFFVKEGTPDGLVVAADALRGLYAEALAKGVEESSS
jgi:hypothetical protein